MLIFYAKINIVCFFCFFPRLYAQLVPCRIRVRIRLLFWLLLLLPSVLSVCFTDCIVVFMFSQQTDLILAANNDTPVLISYSSTIIIPYSSTCFPQRHGRSWTLCFGLPAHLLSHISSIIYMADRVFLCSCLAAQRQHDRVLLCKRLYVPVFFFTWTHALGEKKWSSKQRNKDAGTNEHRTFTCITVNIRAASDF